MLEDIDRYIRRFVRKKDMSNAYNNCMYVLDLKLLDENISTEINNDISTYLDLAKEIIACYYNMSKQLKDLLYKNRDLLYEWYDMFEKVYNRSDEEYKNLIQWPLERARNIYRLSDEKCELYFNMLLRRTSEYLSFGITKQNQMFRFIELIINQMGIDYAKARVSKDFIDEYKNKKCVAVAKIEYNMYGKIEYGIAFSGFWDNASIVNKFNPKHESKNDKNEQSFKELYSYIMKKIKYKNIDTSKMIWCRMNYDQVSYRIHPVTGAPHRLSDFGKERLGCCKKHFSCCERKILANIRPKKINNLKIYVTKEPCLDCEKAIKDMNGIHKHNFITVIWKHKYTDNGHSCGGKYTDLGGAGVS